jgi:hypothetical protein
MSVQKRVCPACGVVSFSELVVCKSDGTLLLPIDAPNEAPEATNIVGSVFGGRYEILEEINSTDTTTDYRARQKLVKRTVRVRLLKEVDAERVKEFQRQCQQQAAQFPPGPDGMMVDFGISEHGVPYAVYVMEGT